MSCLRLFSSRLKCVGTAADTDTDIVIKPADKGSGTVVMSRQNYLDECYRQLNDPSFYKRVNEDPTGRRHKQASPFSTLRGYWPITL